MQMIVQIHGLTADEAGAKAELIERAAQARGLKVTVEIVPSVMRPPNRGYILILSNVDQSVHHLISALQDASLATVCVVPLAFCRFYPAEVMHSGCEV
ncbi:MAG: hypothetical protein WC465_01140 [Patescibacteria group bacterium]